MTVLKQQQAPGRREIVLLIAILLLAGILRLAWPGLTEFKRDEALLMARALEMVDSSQLAVRGITSSVGFPNFPASVWFYALPLAVWQHVYSATFFTGLLNLAAILGCWWLTRRYWGGTVALVATLLFAVSPWAIFHSQKIWAQNLLPPLVVGWAIAAGLAFVEGRKWFVVLHLLFLAVAIQVHFAAVALLPATIIFLLVFRRRVEWRLVILSALLGLLIALPFLLYVIDQPELNPAALVDAGGEIQRGFNIKAWRFTWLLSTGREIHALAGPQAFEAYLAGVPDLTLVHVFWAALIVAGAVWLGRAYWQRRASGDAAAEMGFIVLVWLLVPLLFYSAPLLPVELHYLLPVYPAQYIIAGVAFVAILARLKEWQPAAGLAAWAVLLLSAIVQVWIWLSLLNFIGSHYTPGGFGTPVRYHLAAADRARQLAIETGAGEVLIAGQSESPGTDEFAAIYDVLLRDIDRRFVDTNHSVLFPAGASVVVLSRQAAEPAANLYLAEAEAIDRFPLRDGEGTIQLVTLPPAAGPRPQTTLDPPALFANWIHLFGYDAPQLTTDQTAAGKLYWHPGDNPDPVAYHLFAHLVAEDGRLLSQYDGPVFNPLSWRPGDTVISPIAMPWPEDEQPTRMMRAGVYSYPELQNVPLLDVAGNPWSDFLELPLVESE